MTTKSVGPSSSDPSKGLVPDEPAGHGPEVVDQAPTAQPVPTELIPAELNPAVRDEQELAHLLDLTARTARGWLPAVDWAGMAVTFDGTSFPGGGAAAGVMNVDRAPQVEGGGPGARALCTAAIVAASGAEAVPTWPELAEQAKAIMMAVHGIGEGDAFGPALREAATELVVRASHPETRT